jgi:hypothetical protein
VKSALPHTANAAYEIVIDGIDLDAVQKATRIGVRAACTPGVVGITSCNYGGKLAPFHLYLHKLLGIEPAATGLMENSSRTVKDHDTYTIAQLLDRKNNALYAEVNRQAPVRLVASMSGYWEGVLDSGGVTSTVSTIPAKTPGPSFAHELLHIKLEIGGLLKPRCVSCPMQFVETVRQFCNDLAHHKMYPMFIEMGYAPDQFMGTEDEGAQKFINETLRDFKKLKDAKKAFPGVLLLGLYFAINNPHDTLLENRTRLIGVVGNKIVANLDQVLADWKTDNTKDYGPYLARVLGACDIRGWRFGMDQDHLYVS